MDAFTNVKNGDLQKGVLKVGISEIMKYPIHAAQATPGGRVFGTFFYASESFLGTLIDE